MKTFSFRTTIGTCIMKWIIGMLPVLILTGCSAPRVEDIGPYPAHYKELIHEYIQEAYFDPYSIRSARISSPRRGYMIFGQGWYVCTQFNTKNRMGGYTGLKDTVFRIRHGVVLGAFPGLVACENEHYDPWPELEGGSGA
ncbi:MAG: hypothetical protein OXF11_12645 [Deltaproteobacteria bacterium]|nr:hypothetical protein [Deltaproteobacteria bacterium]